LWPSRVRSEDEQYGQTGIGAAYPSGLPHANVAEPPNWHYLLIYKDVIPALRKRCVTEDQIHTMLADNPRVIFEKQDNPVKRRAADNMGSVPPLD
jgi:hypothetical protein